MKRCPECRRDYTDDSLSFCLDDGARLLEGPATDEPKTRIQGVTHLNDEPQTALLYHLPGEAPTKYQSRKTGKSAVVPETEIENPPKTQTASNGNAVIAGIIVIVLVTTLGIGSYWRYGTRSNKQIESIAVMPFVNESGNQDMEYLSDGMTETLISSLSQLPNLNVKARSSVFRYKGKETDARVVGKELNVQAVLNGRVVQRGQDLILYVTLIDAQTENVLWKADYSKRMANLVSLQSEIARDVSQKLKTKLSGADEQKLTKNYTENSEAYKLYLQGRFYASKRTNKDLEKSIEYFNQAIAVDPNYALALAGLADSYALLPGYFGASALEMMPKAKDAALKALSLDNDLAEAHAALGQILGSNDYDFVGAEREYKRALELNPNYATAHQYYGELLTNLGRHEESFAEFRRALEIDPLSLIINRMYGEALFFARRYDESIAQVKKTLELDADFASAHRSLSNAYWAKENYMESVEEFAKYQELLGEYQVAARSREVFAKAGWKGYLQGVTGEERPPSLPSYIAAVYLAELGEKDKAFAELEKSYEKREAFQMYLKVDPRLDPLRNNLRFQELLRKVGFP
ncbi:MAG: serine/threonine protein kinase with repeat [Acidobacteria bacterium]|nr:serine/threonine protein kinase with repeat [Acidobacteriota bacterium]